MVQPTVGFQLRTVWLTPHRPGAASNRPAADLLPGAAYARL